ncbi:E3 ubiquitin-protein ligase [Klebsormidium nitens]|uniref:HECT-type E3 ubiquitin transferase n=1 Tax=Klebsormidium nitens TaxID=105231 RepID=A0A1Y1IEQ0_KLENI|nr:E3 ubiquitin-protein ligase [Klebsormidium nitens]|eukprot:GAQ89414.1 E3 ubiquitin-protein ligase [Klebsormidium nitens]
MTSGNPSVQVLQFFVKNLDGATRVLRMDPKICITDVIRTALHDEPRSVVCQVQVKYKNRLVPLERTLEQSGVQNLDTLHLTGCLRNWRSKGWQRAFELFRRVRDCCKDALAGGKAEMSELPKWLKDFLETVNKECIASEQQLLGQIMLEEGGVAQLAGCVLGHTVKHPEASVIAVQQCIIHILQSCASGLRSTVFHVAGPLFWSLQEPPLLSHGHSDAVGRFWKDLAAPGVRINLSENASLLTAALRRVLSHGQHSDASNRIAVQLFCTLIRTVRNQLSLESPTPEQPPAPKKKGWFVFRKLTWKREPPQATAPVVTKSNGLGPYPAADALRACCAFLQSLGPKIGKDILEEAVAEIRPFVSPGRPLAEHIYTQQQWVRFCVARTDDTPFHVAVARGPGLLSDALEQLADVPKERLAGGLTVHFEEEDGAGPGLLREFFTLVSRALFDPAAALFAPSPRDRRRFHINPASDINPGHLAHFALCGRLLGLAMANGTPLGVRFSSILCAVLLGPLEDADARTLLRSVQDADPELYASCSRLLEMDDAELAAASLPFVCTVERRLGAPEEVPLCEGGRDVVVTAANREGFVARKVVTQLVTPVEKQAAALAGGLGDVLREGVTLREFLLPLNGGNFGWPLDGDLEDLSIADWQKHTEYHDLLPTCRHVTWFWQCVEGFTPPQRRRLLFFATSVEFLPPAGFAALPSKFHIWKGGTQDGLPTAHTCFYQLVLPEYKSLYAMRKQLEIIVQSDVWEGFGMSDVALELLAANKKRVLYATKLLIEAPLVGLCALNVWAHWGDSARASGEPAAGYALALALAGAYTLLTPCAQDLVSLKKAAQDYTLLRRILLSEEEELPLDWDTDDEESLELHHELATVSAVGGVCAEGLLVLLWAACNCVFPPKCEYDVWARHLWLFGEPVEVVRGVVFHMCTCLALEARKWAVNTWRER